MKQVSEVPSKGQFVAVYTFNEKLWSGTYSFDDDGLFTEYCLYEDEFTPVGGMGDKGSLPWVYNKNTDVSFFVVY